METEKHNASWDINITIIHCLSVLDMNIVKKKKPKKTQKGHIILQLFRLLLNGELKKIELLAFKISGTVHVFFI